ncbi:DUF2293 domain-containing protein [Saccharolobus islandicus]|nr:DUF2293 domain-containing protein [Sulfolobus islandicus]
MSTKVEEKEEKKYIYKSTAKKIYKITDNQINEAIERGILTDYKYRRNPHYRSAPESLLLNPKEIEEKLELIKQLPKYSEEEKQRKVEYQRKWRKANELVFYCPLCNKNIRPPRDSEIRELYIKDLKDKDNSITGLIIAHLRHQHTDYDQKRLEAGKVVPDTEEECKEIVTEDGDIDEECYEVPLDPFEYQFEKARYIGSLKKSYNRKVIDIAIKNGMLVSTEENERKILKPNYEVVSPKPKQGK